VSEVVAVCERERVWLWAESGLLKQREGEIMSIEFIILIVVLVVLFGGGGGYYWSRRGG
jgi:hypothetical protein